jgi:conjugal transfer pilus assembly protein TraB
MSDQIKYRQYLLLWGIIIVLTSALVLASILLVKAKKANHHNAAISKKNLTTGVSRVNPQELWVHDFTTKDLVTQKRLDAIEQTLEQLLKINTASKSLEPPNVAVKEPDVVENLKQDLVKSLSMSTTVNELPPIPNNRSVVDPVIHKIHKDGLRAKGLKKISLNLNNGAKQHKLLKTTDNTLPAGAFAQAILLGGVDASTSIQAASDPRPILLRLINPGTLPRRFKSDLAGCHVLAASYGDLSSERVYMRLEKLGCVERKTGEIIEMNIQGYVAGEDGKAGIRGSIVDKSGATMRNAMIGGFVSSIGKFLGQARTPILVSPNGLAQNAPLNVDDIFKQSAANGVGGALDKYADFYIKRAEQMQPVIQVAAGRQVDIVFTHGIDFATSQLRQVLSKTNDQKRYQQVQNLDDTKQMSAWLPTGDTE